VRAWNAQAAVPEVAPSAEQMLLEMQQAISRGMFRIVAAMHRDGLYYVDNILTVWVQGRACEDDCSVLRMLPSPDASLRMDRAS
jgi:hypothetical protein